MCHEAPTHDCLNYRQFLCTDSIVDGLDCIAFARLRPRAGAGASSSMRATTASLAGARRACAGAAGRAAVGRHPSQPAAKPAESGHEAHSNHTPLRIPKFAQQAQGECYSPACVTLQQIACLERLRVHRAATIACRSLCEEAFRGCKA